MRRDCFSLLRSLLPLSAVLTIILMMSASVWGATAVPPLGLESLNQIPVQEPANLYQFVKNKSAAIRLGKALFWDMQVGSDGMTACATCHFSAGTDRRTKNTLHPGSDGLFNVLPGPNLTLQQSNFPFHQRQAPGDFQASTILRDSDDRVGSQGVRLKQFVSIVLGSRFDNGTDITDPIFNVNGVNVRQVTGRNTPTVINAAFNFTNFWDGRASAFFNGVNPFGPLDTTAGVWFNVNGVLVKQPVSIMFASLASQATGPPLSDVEMSFRGRTFPQLGRKMLNLTPLAVQYVHPDDSELGAHSLATLQPDGTLVGSKGLDISYREMIMDAFQNNLWNSGQLTPGGFSQMEANFSLYWGLAIQLYEATLIADDTPFDRFLGGETTALSAEQQEGFNLFFGTGRCNVCHFGSETTNASHTAAAFLNNATHALIELMPVASGKQIIYDNGFNNTAVTKTSDDIGRAGDSPFINLLTGVFFPLSFCDQAELQAQVPKQLPFAAPILPANIPADFPVANKGAFKVPGLRNVELTAPFMHNGGMDTLEEMVNFYTRGGNFPNNNKANLDINIAEIPAMQNDPVNQAAMVAFMKAMTDERVRNEAAPFDHPEIFIPNGDSVNDTDLIHLVATGIDGIPNPVIATVLPAFPSPQLVGTVLLFTANASGGSGAYEYQFWLKDTNGVDTLVQPFSTTNRWIWNTAAASGGTYTITAQVRNATGTSAPSGFDAVASTAFVLTAPAATGATLSPNKPSPQPKSTPSGVTFNATGLGGSGSYEFEFWMHNGTSWSKVQNYSATSSFNWDTTTATAGVVYTFQVNVRSSGSTAAYEATQAINYVVTAGPATGATLTPDKVSPQPQNTPGGVTFNAAGTGGSGSYEFEFWMHNGTSWSKVQNYSATSSFNWDTTTATAGAVYTFQVNVRSSGSTAAYEATQSVNYIVTAVLPASGASLSPDKASPQPQNTPGGVTFNATGTGGSGSYEFEFWMHNGTSWSKVQNYSATSSFNWNTTSAIAGVVYTFQVNVRNAGSAAAYEASQAINYVVTAGPATGATLTPSKTSPQPLATAGTITFAAAGQGGSGSYEFEFWLHDGTSWALQQGYSTTANWIWNAATGSTGVVYTIQVNVRNAGSTDVYQAYQALNFILQ